MIQVWRPWRESNPHLGLRSALLYPLSYGGVRHALYRTVTGSILAWPACTGECCSRPDLHAR